MHTEEYIRIKNKITVNSNVDNVKMLTTELNKARDLYYNKQAPVLQDFEYDELYDTLELLEHHTGVVYSNSPTVTVGYESVSELKKVEHSHPMLSLSKTKTVQGIKEFAGNKGIMMTLKMDGLTVLLTYKDGKLVRAETRGNGYIGEDITHNAFTFKNIPIHIKQAGKVEIEGEAIITYKDFETINETENTEFKHPRNLVSGSVRQLDSKVAQKRHIKFVAWKLVDSTGDFEEDLFKMAKMGFDVVPSVFIANNAQESEIEENLHHLKTTYADYPSDGVVATYVDTRYGKSLGITSHHPKHSIAYKFYDEAVTTNIKYIDWTIGKTGVITPTAVFDPVEIDGTIVERASVHNVSILEELDLRLNDEVEVYKSNMIIPQVRRNISKEKRDNNQEQNPVELYPKICPICKHRTHIKIDNKSKILVCDNPFCKGTQLAKLKHFVSKEAMNIEGLSESTLKKLVELGYVYDFVDIYELKNNFYDDILKLEGFGKKSVDKLMKSIEDSKNTTLDRFLNALSIPLIGKTASKLISDYYSGNYEDFYNYAIKNKLFSFSNIDGIGYAAEANIRDYFNENLDMVEELASYMTFAKKENSTEYNEKINNKIFVITGKLNRFTNRNEAIERIEANGGKVTGSVSKNTDYLVNNDIKSTSGKNKKAKELNIPIITEDELIGMIG